MADDRSLSVSHSAAFHTRLTRIRYFEHFEQFSFGGLLVETKEWTSLHTNGAPSSCSQGFLPLFVDSASFQLTR